MSMNENLEFRVSELTNVVRGLSDRPQLSASDINVIVSNLIQKVEDKNEEGVIRLTNEVSETLIDVLERKNLEIKERLVVFENFVTNVEKTFENAKVDAEITRILNDIEALHSKMNSQEIQTEALIKAFDGMKNNSSSVQVAKLCDEILSISKSYDGIVEVLNNNFQEFLRRVENSSSREDYQRLRFMIEAIEGNQNVLVSSVNAVNEKQEEIKNLLRQSTGSVMLDKVDSIQNFLNQLNRNVVDNATKADLEVISDKFATLGNLIDEIKRSIEEASNSDVRAVFQGQLNNIIAQLENIRANSNANLNEDLIRLYSSIAEFRDGVNLAISSQMNDVVASVEAQIDRVSNSVSSATLDATDSVNNMIGEVQKLSSYVADGFNSKTYEIKEDIKKSNQEAITTVVNSIKGELTGLISEVSALNNSESLNNLFLMVENLKNGLDIDSIVVQMGQIKDALDFDSIKEQLSLLNKDETIRLIGEKIDFVIETLKNDDCLVKIAELGNSNKEEILSKIGEIKGNSSFEILSKIDELKENLNNENVYQILESINNKIEDKIMENKEDDNRQNLDEIKDNLKTLYQAIIDNNGEESISNLFNKIDDCVLNINSKVENSFENSRYNLENSLNILSEKINSVDLKLNNNDEEKLEELKNQITELHNFVKDINQNPISEQIEVLKQNLSALSVDNIQEVKQEIEEFQNTLVATLSAVKNNLSESLDKENLSNSIYPLFENFEIKMSEKLSSIEALVEKSANDNESNFKDFICENLDKIKAEINEIVSKYIENAVLGQTDIVVDLVKNQTNEAKLEVANYLKQETEIVNSLISEKAEYSQREILEKISQMLTDKENSESRINFINSVNQSLSEILGNTNLIKDGFEANSDVINQLNGTISNLDLKLEDFISKNSVELEEKLNSILANNSTLKAQLADIIFQNNLDLKKQVERVIENIDKNNILNAENNEKIEKTVNVINTNVDKSLNLIQEKIENLFVRDRDENKNQFSEIKEILTKSVVEKISEQLREDIEEVKSTLSGQIIRNEGNIDSLLNFTNDFEVKMQEKISIIEDVVSDKIEFLVSQIKQEYETKLAEVQKIIDDRVYDILNRNNEIIKDELKLRADATIKDISKDFKDKFDKIENAISTGGVSIDDNDSKYTMADVESDMAKIRLGLEKNNKLTNFKEFASRLVELKNINLENAKISRVIGADIMRFDGWLKNTTAKIEVLAAKIDKSEKIKMEDLKSRLIQTEKSQAMPQKIEEVVMSIYKKYRSQETKIDDLLNKIDNLNQKQTDHFDVREFIDVIYDTTKKQESLISRMDNIEDKMDLIQAKIDHIISSCIDE